MVRNASEDIEQWKKDKNRKPLLLKGARQVGKTWLVDNAGKMLFNNNYIKFDFLKDKDIHEFFKKSINPNEIIKSLSLYANKKIDSETLIFFDEIQECNDALNSLKYFNEGDKKYYIIAAGSLLGLHLGGFPVGQTNEICIHPLSFDEYLMNYDKSIYEYFLNIKIDTIIEIPFHNKLLNFYNEYLIIGGMPEALNE
ncbi:hypothetical protein FACS189459_2960 [Bacilli bacterium]|nr:hypothetical protein FACS189459_2960 [Bacilli bacterium]GHU51704.1 hypothetical protein FACS189496_0470 [Bacilli bacterium]